MPENILGQPKDEEKWERAKRQAEEQGEGGNYAYIMSIYKNMAGLNKGVDSEYGQPYTKHRRLVVRKQGMKEYRCPECNHLQFRGSGDLTKSRIEIKCRKCGTVNRF